MKRVLTLAGLLVLICGVGTILAGSNVWVSSDGKEHSPHGDFVFIGEDDEGFDLSQLADGETRVFGSGDSQVTVRRDGEVATIHRPAAGEKSELEMTCNLGSDTCRVSTIGGDPERVMVMVKTERQCIDGEGDCDHDEMIAGLGGAGHTVVIRKIMECDGNGDCTEDLVHAGGESGMIQIEALASGAGAGEVVVVGDGGHWVGNDKHSNVFVMAGDDKATLRCPEGDTTMRVDKVEADDVFLCPKHSEPLVKVEHKMGMHKIEIITDDGKVKHKDKDDANEY